MAKSISIREFISNFNAGKYNSKDFETQVAAGWYDWFCKTSSLRDKTYALVPKIKQLLASPKINQDTMYVFFKNNYPMQGSLYDDFRFCDMTTGNVIYTVTPSCGHESQWHEAQVWGYENEFEEPIIAGTWTDVVKFFMRSKSNQI